MPRDSNKHHSTLLLSLAARRGWEGRTEVRYFTLGFCSLAPEQREGIVRKLFLCTQWEMFWTSKLANGHINVPSGGQSSPWLALKQRKDENLSPPAAIFFHNTHKSNAPVPHGALNYLLNWLSFPHCCGCTNSHFRRRPWNCREVTRTAYCNSFTPFNKCIIVKTPGLYGSETKSSTSHRFEPRPIILHLYMQSYKGLCKEQACRMQCKSVYNME